MSNYNPPAHVRVVSDDGGFVRVVEYVNGAQAEQYYDVASDTWINETDGYGNFVTLQDQEDDE